MAKVPCEVAYPPSKSCKQCIEVKFWPGERVCRLGESADVQNRIEGYRRVLGKETQYLVSLGAVWVAEHELTSVTDGG